MPSYGIFEDDILVTGTFSDSGVAEDTRDRLKADTGMVYGVLEVLELCPEHMIHAFGMCTPEHATDTELLGRLKDALQDDLDRERKVTS